MFAIFATPSYARPASCPPPGALTLKLVAGPERVALTDTIRIVAIVRNISDRPVFIHHKLVWGRQGNFDIRMYDPQGREVYSPMLASSALTPGELKRKSSMLRLGPGESYSQTFDESVEWLIGQRGSFRFSATYWGGAIQAFFHQDSYFYRECPAVLSEDQIVEVY